MPRKACVIGLCLVALLAGCKKKTEPGDQTTEVSQDVHLPPAGMTQLTIEGQALFITKKPVSVADYVAFLQQTGQPAPAALASGLEQAGAAVAPVDGLSLDQALAYGKWQLMRLPTAEEWEHAGEVVGREAYPWGEELTAGQPRPGAKLFLVRDWESGSQAEQQARQAREESLGKLRAQHLTRIAALKGQVEEFVEAGSERLDGKWKQLKPKLSGVVQDTKELADLGAREEIREKILEVLGEDGRQKLKIADLQVSDATPEAVAEAVQQYEQFLAGQRNSVQKRTDELLAACGKAQETAFELKEKLDQAGLDLVERFNVVAEPILLDAGEQLGRLESLEKLLAVQERLEGLLKKLEAAEGELTGLLAEMEQEAVGRAAELKKQIEALAGEGEAAAKVAEMQKKITEISDHIEKQFAHEPQLYQQMAGLLDAAARRKALATEADELKKTLNAFEPAEADAEETPVPE